MSRGNLKFLLVDDNKLNQLIVKFSLKQFSYNIVTANNGIEAIEKFKKNKFDFILMDLMMPEMDGMEAAKIIRKLDNGKKIPIIALSSDEMILKEEYQNSGINAHMFKPFKLKNFFDVLESLNF